MLALYSKKRPVLVEVPITGHHGERDIAQVGNESLAFDKSFATFANLASASWQQITFTFDECEVARVRVKSYTYEGNVPSMQCGGVQFSPSAANEVEWFDVGKTASGIYIFDPTGGRTRLYELSLFKYV